MAISSIESRICSSWQTKPGGVSGNKFLFAQSMSSNSAITSSEESVESMLDADPVQEVDKTSTTSQSDVKEDSPKGFYDAYEERVKESPILSKYYEKLGGIPYHQGEDGIKIPALLFLEGGDIGGSGSINGNLEMGLELFQDEFSDWMRQEDVFSNPPINLKSNSSGQIVVEGDHPQKDKIEAYFKEHDDMANFFKGMTAAKSLIEIGKESSKFQEAYRIDPQAAIREYSHFFSGKYYYESSLNISDSGFDLFSEPKWAMNA